MIMRESLLYKIIGRRSPFRLAYPVYLHTPNCSFVLPFLGAVVILGQSPQTIYRGCYGLYHACVSK